MKRIVYYATVSTEIDDEALGGDEELLSLLLENDDKVQSFIHNGWQPFGPLRVHYVGTTPESAIQVMVKYADDEQYD